MSLCVFHLRVSRCCLFILWSWECHETRSLFLSIWCLSWPQAWANVSGPSVIGTLGPKWRRATCLPAHFLSSAHTLGLAIAMPAHTHTVWCTQTHTDTQKNAAGSTLYTVKHWNLHKHAISQGVSMTELPTYSLLLYLCSHYAFQAIHSINNYTIIRSGDHINVKNKSWFWMSTLDPIFFTFSLSHWSVSHWELAHLAQVGYPGLTVCYRSGIGQDRTDGMESLAQSEPRPQTQRGDAVRVCPTSIHTPPHSSGTRISDICVTRHS